MNSKDNGISRNSGKEKVTYNSSGQSKWCLSRYSKTFTGRDGEMNLVEGTAHTKHRTGRRPHLLTEDFRQSMSENSDN